jgi:dihydrofolate reductase
MNLPRFNVIIATDSNGGFSYNNKLPWKFVKDSSFYNTITCSNTNYSSNILIMGRKTWESMNCVVPKNRIAFVISNDHLKYTKTHELREKKNLYFFPSFLDALSNASNFKESIVWVIGGYQIYDEALTHPNCASIYCTLIRGSFKTDKRIDLNTYNIKWVNIHQEIDVNLKDNLNYILYFKRGFIDKH